MTTLGNKKISNSIISCVIIHGYDEELWICFYRNFIHFLYLNICLYVIKLEEISLLKLPKTKDNVIEHSILIVVTIKLIPKDRNRSQILKKKDKELRVAQWGIHLPAHETQVGSLVQEDPACSRAIGPHTTTI